MNYIARYTFILILIILPLICRAQTELPVVVSGDTSIVESGYDVNAPRKAFLYAALLPGLGQAYNRQYWKMPVVYGGFIGFGYVISYYNGRHQSYKSELFKIIDDPAYVSSIGVSESQLRTLVDRARRERDYMIVLTGAFYLLQIVDAHVDAHLREFDLNPDLQVKIKPSFEPTLTSSSIGVGLKFKF